MCVDCVLASLRITQVDPSDEPFSDVVLSQPGYDNDSHFNSQLPDQLYRVYCPPAILAKTPSNRTTLCSSAAPSDQAHQQSSDSYY
jgi:hypothetical protein